MDYRQTAKNMVEGAIDYHIHGGPDIFPRLLNDIEIARQAKDAKMRAVLLKSHSECTAARAVIAYYVTGFSVYGGIALNHSVGGLNPDAVRVAAKMGAKQVWMPTIHAKHYLGAMDNVPMFAKQLKGGNIKGISLLNDDCTLKDAVNEIIDIIAEAGIVLATGHISFEEAMILIDGAKKGGVKKIVVTHPTSPMEGYTIDQMKEALSRGASMLEHVVNDTTHQMKNPIPSAVISDAIKATGAAHTIMSTDSGQVINPAPVISLENFICMMLEDGISEQDIRVMTRDNPAKMIGINPESERC
ncbi:MAG: DUF6282 family protein [Synergistaceae bacterium]|jgi:hypothetical protein|nr:DUF6282 family protein [Synergistaceae bacterium]